MTEGIRRYKEVMLWFHRDERIETLYEKKKKSSVPVEYYDAIDPIPDYMGTKINIIIGPGK